MPLTLSYQQIALRLALTFLAGWLIGWNRDEKARPAGLSTTILVSLAACIAMIQVNLLMNSTGKAPDSFVVLDLMRLPLGILSGIGFIGGGAIFRKGDMVLGVTTAATLWFVAVLGLCFVGGQLILGLVGLGLAIVVLWNLKQIEKRINRNQNSTLIVTLDETLTREESLRASSRGSGFQVLFWSIQYQPASRKKTVKCGLLWRARHGDPYPPSGIEELEKFNEILNLEWVSQPR